MIGTVVGTLAILYLAREVFIPLSFALALTLILTPLTIWFQRIHLGRVTAVMVVMTSVVVGAGVVSWMVGNELIDVIDHLPSYGANIHNKIQGLRSPSTGALGRVEKSVAEIGKELAGSNNPSPPSDRNRRIPSATPENPLPVEVMTPEPGPLVYLQQLTRPFLAPLGMFGFVLILTVFILIKREDLRNRLLRLVGVSQLHATTQALDDATQRISRYLVLQFVVNSLMGVALAIGLEIIGVPYAALWGVLAALLRLVPYLGILAAAIMPFTLSLAVFDGWLHPALVLALFFVLEMIVGNFVEPWLYGAHTGISSLGLLVSTIFWTILWGYPGLILSTPLTVCVVVLGRYVPQLSFLHIALSDQDVLSTELQLYQRLLAMDHVEAREVVDQFLKEQSLLALYEQVIVPALILAEQERHRGILEQKREDFIFLCLNEIVAELSEAPPKPAHRGRIFVIPAKDAADEVSGALFAQLMEREGFAVISLPAGSQKDDLAVLKPSTADIICVSALPPFAFSAAAKLCAQLRTRYPEPRIMAGIWGFPAGRESMLQKLEQSTRMIVATSFTQALEQTAAEPMTVG
ncbi:MAG TPA: AI-2E family transporter [Bryobacteraceae bacterium]|jgi:predicted PurR-regulated permease PerM|nr:AI-2E family transporter [Bryobacteraceae bacterium]